METIANKIRELAVNLEGDIVKKFRVSPSLKPPRRRPSIHNKTNRSDYSRNYMRKYREEGKDYQKIPDAVKKFRAEQRKHFKEHFNLKTT